MADSIHRNCCVSTTEQMHAPGCRFAPGQVYGPETIVQPEAPKGIPGMGKDAPMAADGLQALSLYRFDLVDARAMFAMTQVLSTGTEKYGPESWRQIAWREHVNHALAHLYAHLAGDTSDEHLTNAMCRVMFALGKHLED